MLNPRYLLPLAAILLTVGGYAQSSVQTRLIENINEMTVQNRVSTRALADEFVTMSDHGRCGDVMILELYVAATLSDNQIETIQSGLNSMGQWSDIDYADTKRSRWEPSVHVTRIHSMTKSYKSSTSRHYNSPQLSETIHRALKFWFDADLKCLNWWYNEIGGPKMLGPALLLLKSELSPWELQQANRVMGRARFKMTGQNKVWLSGNILMRGLLIDDMTLVEQARDSIVSEIYVSTEEGVQPDNSFHQHGAQMQFGNYGLAYAGTISYWARVLSGTPLAVSQERIGYISGYLLQGLQWTVWRGNMDVSASGRQVFQKTQKGKAHAVAVALLNMLSVDPQNAKEYKRYIYENQVNTSTTNSLLGHKVFPRSDYSIHRTATWYGSVRMHSDRLIGFEMTNHENLQGVYSSDGALMVMCDGGEYNDIYPVWDWKYLPGTTVQDNGKPIEYFHPENPVNRANFVGSATDGKQGVSAMVLQRDSMEAYKSYFFIDNAIVCLGSGISTTRSLPIHTSIEQSYLRSGVHYGMGRKEQTLSSGKELSNSNISWLHHHKVGYYMFDRALINLSTTMQHGDWSKIATFYEPTRDSAMIFRLSIDHGTRSPESYAYCVLPDRTATQTKAFAKQPTLRILSNTTHCQAVETTDGSHASFVFYKPTTIKLKEKALLRALNTGVVILNSTNGNLQVTVSDPTKRLSAFKMEITGHYSGLGATYNSSTNLTTIQITLPTTNGMEGSSVMRRYETPIDTTSWRERVVQSIGDSVLLKAQYALAQQPTTVTTAVCPRSSGGIHDFYSEGDYWWANPADPNGPYIRRDGETNPDNFSAHRHAMIRFSEIVGALASAYLITGDELYVQHAFKHINAWFADSLTMMNPNLLYAQAIKGVATGRGIGIIDTIHLIEVAQGVMRMQDASCIDPRVLAATKEWFSNYLEWLTTHKYGLDEMNAKNNHGSCWTMQVAAFARLTDNVKLLDICAERFSKTLLPTQLADNGSFPLETARTKPYGYSLFNVDAMSTICQIFAGSQHDLWSARNPNGYTMRRAVDFIAPYIADKTTWGLPKDVMYWDEWPVAHPSMLFAAVRFNDQRLFELWRTHKHSLSVEEVVRNMPIRNPLLWL